jgi:hypothetical protein
MVHGLLDSARTGTSALAVRSEAGIGETALLGISSRKTLHDALPTRAPDATPA